MPFEVDREIDHLTLVPLSEPCQRLQVASDFRKNAGGRDLDRIFFATRCLRDSATQLDMSRALVGRTRSGTRDLGCFSGLASQRLERPECPERTHRRKAMETGPLTVLPTCVSPVPRGLTAERQWRHRPVPTVPFRLAYAAGVPRGLTAERQWRRIEEVSLRAPKVPRGLTAERQWRRGRRTVSRTTVLCPERTHRRKAMETRTG